MFIGMSYPSKALLLSMQHWSASFVVVFLLSFSHLPVDPLVNMVVRRTEVNSVM